MESIAFSSLSGARQQTTSASAETLGQDDFLRLLTTQLTSQSPLDPMDNEAFVAQMAQFSSVSGISEMNDSLKGLRADLSGDRLGEAAAYVGRTALVFAASVFNTGDATRGAIDLRAPATSVTVDITDANGALIRRLQLGSQDAGATAFSWDGRTASGDPAGAGPFALSATAQARNGGTTTVPLFVEGRVSAVSLDGNTTMLSIDGIGSVRADQVQVLS
ncbi:MAG: flagellar hook capping FlgD N-terminal domain-containing protein [Pacificimonas sp.]